MTESESSYASSKVFELNCRLCAQFSKPTGSKKKCDGKEIRKERYQGLEELGVTAEKYNFLRRI